jgi:ribosome-associated protein
MTMIDEIQINRNLTIPADEIRFRFSRSGGPGGQHVNKTSTKAELLFNVMASPSLSERQRRRLLKRLTARISGEGILRVEVRETRSQSQNRAIALERFRRMVADALRPQRRRIPTNPTRQSKEKRIEEKKQRGEIKRLRSGPR